MLGGASGRAGGAACRDRAGVRVRLLAIALLASVWFGALAALAPDAAHAVDGTWTGPGAEWTTGTNWSSSPTFPDNTATFTNNGAPTSVTITSGASINTIQFNSGAPAYSFAIGGVVFSISGTGIVNNSAFAPSLTNNGGTLNFNNASMAGNATITNNNVLIFSNTSTAGSAAITNNIFPFFQQHEHGRQRRHYQQWLDVVPRCEHGRQCGHHQQRRRQPRLVLRQQHCRQRQHHHQQWR